MYKVKENMNIVFSIGIVGTGEDKETGKQMIYLFTTELSKCMM